MAYVVEMFRVIDELRGETGDGPVTEQVRAWVEVGRDSVPSRTKLATVRDRAATLLHESGHALGEGPWTLRVLPVAHDAPFDVHAETEVRLTVRVPS